MDRWKFELKEDARMRQKKEEEKTVIYKSDGASILRSYSVDFISRSFHKSRLRLEFNPCLATYDTIIQNPYRRL